MLKVKTLCTRLLYTICNSSRLTSKADLSFRKRYKRCCDFFYRSALSLKLSLLSIKVPKYLKFDTTLTGLLFILTGTNTFLVFLAFSTNSFVLPTFISKKLYSHHSFKSETCEKYVARESSFNSSSTSAMSSANLKRQVTADCKFIWLVYIENNMGERTHPWGAPEFSTTSSDRYPFTQTRCGRSRRKSLIHSTRFELTCKSISLFSSTYGSIVLNELEKSLRF